MLFAFNAILLIEFRPSYLPTYLCNQIQMQEQQNLEPAIVSNLLCNTSTLSGSKRGMYRIEIKNLNKMHELLKHRIDHRINFTKISKPKTASRYYYSQCH